MTIEESNRFDKTDKKLYKIDKNEAFSSWILSEKQKHYLSIKQMEDLVELLINWYEIKYPERMLKQLDGGIECKGLFSDIKSISEHFTFEQLLYRLQSEYISTLIVPYYSGNSITGELVHHYDREGNPVKLYNDDIYMLCCTPKKDKINFFSSKDYIYINREGYVNLARYCFRGEIEAAISPIPPETSIKIEEFYEQTKYLKEDGFNMSEVEDCIARHNFQLEVRRGLLNAVQLGLIYSSNTIAKYGLARAAMFRREVEKELSGLKLDVYTLKELLSNDGYVGDDYASMVQQNQAKGRLKKSTAAKKNSI